MTEKNKSKKGIYKILITVILVLLMFFFGYIIFKTDLLQSKVNELTASYISFNNSNSTDMLRITNIKKRKDKNGKSSANDDNISFEVTGEKNQSFQIVLYSLGNKIDDNYIKIYLENKDKNIETNLSKVEITIDDGKIILKGKISDNNKYRLYVWIDNKYKEDTKNISYEVKIKT